MTIPYERGYEFVYAVKPEDGVVCSIHSVHHPSVAVVVEHHVVPEYLAQRLSTQQLKTLGYAETVWLCGTGDDNVHEAIAYLLGEGTSPAARFGPATWDLARAGVAAYRQAFAASG